MVEQNQNGRQSVEIVPPESSLNVPLGYSPESLDSPWLVVARNARINKAWEDLCVRNPEKSKECYEHLLLTPTVRKRGKIFPLKGDKYRGVWEYEFPAGDRVFYIPDTCIKKVNVYYADKHPKGRAPKPKKEELRPKK